MAGGWEQAESGAHTLPRDKPGVTGLGEAELVGRFLARDSWVRPAKRASVPAEAQRTPYPPLRGTFALKGRRGWEWRAAMRRCHGADIGLGQIVG